MEQKKIYVSNLPFSTSESDFEKLFSIYGVLENVKLITDRRTGQSRGFGFITYASQNDAESALAMNGEELKGRKLVVNMAKEKTSKGVGLYRLSR